MWTRAFTCNVDWVIEIIYSLPDRKSMDLLLKIERGVFMTQFLMSVIRTFCLTM